MELNELLMGYKDSEDKIHREFEVREMTGEDEEAISKNEVKNNGGKVIRTILERCVTRIGDFEKSSYTSTKWRDIINSLTVADQDLMLLKIRTESFGDELEVTHTCPNSDCKEKLNTIINADELEIRPFLGERELSFTLPKGYTDKNGVTHKEGIIRFPNGLDRELLDTVARKNLGTANTMLLTRCVLELGTVTVYDKIIRELSRRDREYLFKLLKENEFGINMQVDVTCSSCGEEFKGGLNLVNFI